MQAKPNFSEDNLSLDGLEDLLEDAESEREPERPTQDFSVEETAKTLGLTRGAVIRRLEDGLLEGYKIRRPYGVVWRVCDSRLFAAQESELTEKQKRIRRFVEQTKRSTSEHSLISNESASASMNACDNQETKANQPDALAEQKSNKQNHYYDDSQQELDELPHVEVSDVDLDEIFLPALARQHELDLTEMRAKLEMTEFQFQDTLNRLDQANYKIGYLEARLETTQEAMRLLTDQHAHQPWWQRWRQWFRTMP